MTAPINPQNPSNLFTPFLPTTYNVPTEEDRRLPFLCDTFNEFAAVVNDKTIGTFTQSTEAFNGLKFAYDTTKKIRNGYQYLVRIKSYPNAGVLVIPMLPNVNPQLIISDVWGSASKPCSSTGAGDGDYFSFLNQGDSRVSFTITDLNITITTTVDLTAYQGFISILYIRDGV